MFEYTFTMPVATGRYYSLRDAVSVAGGSGQRPETRAVEKTPDREREESCD
jgi:hypothetical protein